MIDLQEVRDTWYAAYFGADINSLKEIELPDFKVISQQGIESSESRYDAIVKASSSGNWYKSSASREEESVTINQLGNNYQVTGLGRVTAKGKILAEVVFSELWLENGGKWKIQSLHISNYQGNT